MGGRVWASLHCVSVCGTASHVPRPLVEVQSPSRLGVFPASDPGASLWWRPGLVRGRWTVRQLSGGNGNGWGRCGCCLFLGLSSSSSPPPRPLWGPGHWLVELSRPTRWLLPRIACCRPWTADRGGPPSARTQVSPRQQEAGRGLRGAWGDRPGRGQIYEPWEPNVASS